MIQNFSFYSNTALRLLLGITFILHGKFKLVWGYANLSEWLSTQGFPFATFFAYVLPWIELIGGLLVLVGVGTRYLSSMFGVILLIALLKVKLSAGFISNSATGYEFDLLLLLVSIHVAVMTPNRFKDVWSSLLKGGEHKNVQSSGHEV